MSQNVRPRSCGTCPFRGGFHLYRTRRAEIALSIVMGQRFHCHSEGNYVEDEDGFSEHDRSGRMCTGAAVVLNRMDIPHPDTVADGATQLDDPRIPFRTVQEWMDEPEFSDDRKQQQ